MTHDKDAGGIAPLLKRMGAFHRFPGKNETCYTNSDFEANAYEKFSPSHGTNSRPNSTQR
jgi:hypothetical protein